MCPGYLGSNVGPKSPRALLLSTGHSASSTSKYSKLQLDSCSIEAIIVIFLTESFILTMAVVQRSTWHTLGLAVATNLAGLGLAAILSPHRTANLFGFRAALSGNTADVPAMMSLVGARDLSLAIMLFSLARTGLHREMGTLILSGMVVCATDIYVVWRRKNWLMFVQHKILNRNSIANLNRRLGLFTAGTAVWGTIGLGLHGFFD